MRDRRAKPRGATEERPWVELAAQYDGHDRWYLEALGIGADGDWDACLAAWMNKVGSNWKSPASRDIVWRSRAAKTPQLLAELIEDPATPAAELPRYLRAFDFLKGPEKERALVDLAFGAQSTQVEHPAQTATHDKYTTIRVAGRHDDERRMFVTLKPFSVSIGKRCSTIRRTLPRSSGWSTGPAGRKDLST